MGESTMTFESLYNLVRNEKTNDAIQELKPETHKQIVSYLNTKIGIYKDAKSKDMNPAEIEKIKTQIVSARKLIKELYERRERKVLHLAINKSRIKNVDESLLLEKEKEMLDEVTKILDSHRKEVLLNLVNARLPDGDEKANGTEEAQNVSVKFTKPVPKFLGKDLETLGPFNPGDQAELDKDIANILIKKEHAVKI